MKVRTVTTYYARMKGLLGTAQHQLDYDAMYLVPCRGVHTFGMSYALDIAFLDADRKVIAVRENVAPNVLCASPKGTRSVLERPASASYWLRPGERIIGYFEDENEESRTDKEEQIHEHDEDLSHL